MMSAISAQLSQKERVFLSLVAQYQPEGGEDLFKFLPPEESRGLKANLAAFLSQSPQQREAEFAAAREHAQDDQLVSMLYLADPGWISESLKGETAAAVGILLPKVPKSRVGSVLKDLPKETRRDLKKLKLKKISPAIRHLIRIRAERPFPRINLALLKEDDVVKKIKDLDGPQLLKTFHELGISEMAMAFSQVQRSALRAIINRLRTVDAKELKQRIKESGEFTRNQQKEAQLHILSLDFDKMNPEQVVQEIGFGVFSKAFGPEDAEIIEYFIHRLPPRSGYVLKRYLDDSMGQSTPEQVKKTRERVLDAFTRLKKTFS